MKSDFKLNRPEDRRSLRPEQSARRIGSVVTSGMRRFVWAWALCALGCLGALAQQDTGGLVVSVRDPNGAVVPDAKVVITNVDTNITAERVTVSTGDCTASPLRPGRYQATVKKEGFKTAISETVGVGPQQIPRVVIRLELGNVSQSVTVTASATVLQTVEASKQMVMSGTLKNELPLLDRNFNQLASLTVGVTKGTPVNAKDRASGGFSAGGIKTTQTRFTLDGIDNTSYTQDVMSSRTFAIMPSMDSIAEFTVQTNAYSAEFGGGGGAAVSVVTKGGGNRLHGSLYEYRQGADLNANSFFNNAKKVTISPYRQDQYGGTLGGPVYIPKVYDGRNRSFFFVDYERLPWRTKGGQANATVPTTAWVNGDFTGGATIYDPQTGEPFPGNQIPASRIDPVAAAIAAALPAPNTEGTVNYYKTGGVPNKTHEYRFAVRGDQKLGANDQVFFRYQRLNQSHPNTGVFTGTILSTDSSTVQKDHGFVINETHTFSPRLVNVVRYGQTRDDYRNLLALAGVDINSQIGLTGIPIQGDGLTGGLTGIQFANSSLSSLGGVGPRRGGSTVHQISDAATWSPGRHLLKFGYEHRRIQFLDYRSALAPIGAWNFDGHYTAGGESAGNPFADFLLGLPNQVQMGSLTASDYLRRSHAAFLQDNFQLNSRLTVNLGVRWEYVTPVREAEGRGSALNPFTGVLQLPGYSGSLPAAVQRQVDAGVISLDRNASKYYNSPPHRRNFGPRLGFAYKLGDRTVLRGGYAIFHGAEDIGLWAEPSVIWSVPSQIQSQYTPADRLPTTINPVTFQTGMPADVLSLEHSTGLTLFALDPSLPTPYYQHWNLTLQRELPHSISVEASYIASRGTHIYRQQDYNIPSATTDASLSIASRQRFPAIDASGNPTPGSAIQAQTADARSHYDGMGIQVQKRTGNATLVSSYTWSHEIDNWCAAGWSYGNNGRPLYPENLNWNMANGDLDVRHRWTSGFVLQAPFGRGQRWGSNAKGVVNHLVSGWRFSGMLTFESGQWFTVNQNFDTMNIGGRSYCGNCRQRPDLVGNPNIGPKEANPADQTVKWFNIDAFQAAAPGQIGTSGRNVLLADGLRNLDAAISKDFRLRESVRLKFQAEFYNFTNTPSFLVAGLSSGSSPSSLYMGQRTAAANVNTSMGTMQGDRGARVVQFSLRLDF